MFIESYVISERGRAQRSRISELFCSESRAANLGLLYPVPDVRISRKLLPQKRQQENGFARVSDKRTSQELSGGPFRVDRSHLFRFHPGTLWPISVRRVC